MFKNAEMFGLLEVDSSLKCMTCFAYPPFKLSALDATSSWI
jgi:hypothetical protein